MHTRLADGEVVSVVSQDGTEVTGTTRHHHTDDEGTQ